MPCIWLAFKCCIPRFKDWDTRAVVKAIEDLDKVDLLVLYPYYDPIHPTAFALQFERFRDFQTIREDREGRSRIPAPPEQCRITPGVPRDHYRFTPLLSLSLRKFKEGRKEKPGVEPKTNTEIYKKTIKLLTNVKGIGEEKATKLTHFIIDELMHDFPELDILEQVKKKCAWWLDNPLNKKSNIHAQMRNWFRLGQKWINEAKAQDQVGKPKPQKPKTKEEIECQRLMKEAEERIQKKNPGKRGREIEFLIMTARAKASQEYWRKKGK